MAAADAGPRQRHEARPMRAEKRWQDHGQPDETDQRDSAKDNARGLARAFLQRALVAPLSPTPDAVVTPAMLRDRPGCGSGGHGPTPDGSGTGTGPKPAAEVRSLDVKSMTPSEVETLKRLLEKFPSRPVSRTRY